MNGSSALPSIEQLKRQAKRLRIELEAVGNTISHSKSLELLAYQLGYKGWNSLHAAIGNRYVASPVSVGQRVSGAYLGQAFQGEVSGVQILATTERFRISLIFDEAVDVVTFDSFSNFRKRVTCVVDANGKTAEKTSNGKSQLVLDLVEVTS